MRLRSLCPLLLLACALRAGDPATVRYLLRPGTATVSVDQELNLSLMELPAGGGRPVAVKPRDLAATTVWSLNGRPAREVVEDANGRLELPPAVGSSVLRNMALYRAPKKVPAKNPVQVAVEVVRPDGVKEVVFASITVVAAANQFTLSGSDVLPNGSHPVTTMDIGRHQGFTASTAMAVWKAQDRVLAVTISGPSPRFALPVQLVLWVNGNQRGLYDWTINPKQEGQATPECGVSLIAASTPMSMVTVTSVDCRPQADGSCTPFALEGSTWLAGVKDGRVSGAFVGRILWADPQTQVKHFMDIAGHFNAVLNEVPGS